MKANSLIYKTSKLFTKNGKERRIYVSIRLNDECKNGHQDFAITGNIYAHPSIKTDRYYVSGGCIHDDILIHFPEFSPFVRLHLCDYLGAPMYPSANGLFHLQNGFNNTKPTEEGFKAEYCEYYRITPAQFDVLSQSENKIEFAILLDELGILAQWKVEADAAIKQLEALTGNEFVIDSTRSNHTPPTIEEITLFRARTAAGYYTPEAKTQRAIDAKIAAKAKAITDLTEEANNKIAKIRHELELELCLLRNDVPTDNVIIYDHKKEIAFNWKGYGNTYTAEEIKAFFAGFHSQDTELFKGYNVCMKNGHTTKTIVLSL